MSRRDVSELAEMQHNLGIAYNSLPVGDRQANLKDALTCYQDALQVYTRQAFLSNGHEHRAIWAIFTAHYLQGIDAPIC